MSILHKNGFCVIRCHSVRSCDEMVFLPLFCNVSHGAGTGYVFILSLQLHMVAKITKGV